MRTQVRDDDHQTHDALRDPVAVLQEIYPATLAMARSLAGPGARRRPRAGGAGSGACSLPAV